MRTKKIFSPLLNRPINYQKYEFEKIQSMDNAQAYRYGFYKKSDFKKEKIKKIVVNFNPFLKNINSSDPLIIAIKSLTKSLIGELIEFSRHLIYEFEENLNWMETPVSNKIINYSLKYSFFKCSHFKIKL